MARVYALKPSRLYLLAMLFVLSGAFICIFTSYLPYYIQILLSALVVVYGGNIIWKVVLLKHTKAIVSLACREDNIWILKERGGRVYQAVLTRNSTRLIWVTVLRFKGLQASVDDKTIIHQRLFCFLPNWLHRSIKHNVVVFCDAMDERSYRRLLMKLITIKVY